MRKEYSGLQDWAAARALETAVELTLQGRSRSTVIRVLCTDRPERHDANGHLVDSGWEGISPADASKVMTKVKQELRAPVVSKNAAERRTLRLRQVNERYARACASGDMASCIRLLELATKLDGTSIYRNELDGVDPSEVDPTNFERRLEEMSDAELAQAAGLADREVH